MRRRVRGDRSFKRILNQLPKAVEEEVRRLLKETGAEVLAEQKMRAPMRTGALKNALSMRVPPKALRLSVGLVGKPINRRFFYGRIIEFGRKGQTVRFRRKGRSASVRTGKPYIMRVRGMAPRPFIYSIPRDQINARFQQVWTAALSAAAAGVGDE